MWVGVRALSSTLFAREAITMIFTAVWALIFSLGKPWLGAAPGKALDGTRARGYRIWAAVSPSSASPRTRKVPLKTGKRSSGYEKADFFFLIFPYAAGLCCLGQTLSMQPASIPRQGKGPWEEPKKSNHMDGTLKLN